MDMSQDDNNEG